MSNIHGCVARVDGTIQIHKSKEEENLNMALPMGGTRQAVEMEGSDPGLVLAYVNYDKIIMDN